MMHSILHALGMLFFSAVALSAWKFFHVFEWFDLPQPSWRQLIGIIFLIGACS